MKYGAVLKSRAGKFSTLGVCGFNEGVLQAIPVEGNFTAEPSAATLAREQLFGG